MTAQLINGNELSKQLRAEVAQRTTALRARGIPVERDFFRMDELAQDLIGRWNHDR